MTTGNYVVWSHKLTDGIAKLDDVKGVENLFDIRFARSRLATWPANATVDMSRKFPNDINLADAMQGQYLFISARLKQLVESATPGNVEFLPIEVINHKGRSASKDYFVMNALDVVDAIDAEESNAEINDIAPEQYVDCSPLVLIEKEIPKKLKLFRLARYTSITVARRDFAEELLASGVAGLRFIEPDQFIGMA